LAGFFVYSIVGKIILLACFCFIINSCYQEDIRFCEYIECRTPEGSIFHISVYKNSDTLSYWVNGEKSIDWKIKYFNWSDTISKYLSLGYKIDTNLGSKYKFEKYFYIGYKDKQTSMDNFLRMYPSGKIDTIQNSCNCNSASMWDRCPCCYIE